MPGFEARRLCPHGIFVPGRMDRYLEVSRTVRTVFESFSPAVEPLSLDEAFIDLGGTEKLLGTPLEVGKALKRRVLEETGLIVSVGIAPNKMAAKILSDLCKPDGLLALEEEHLRDFLFPLPVERLWGVGRVTLQHMHDLGIHSIGDLAVRDPAELRAAFGVSGNHLWELANGIDARPVIPDWQRKSYGEENTFERDLDLHGLELQRILIAHGEAIGRRLRADSVRARTVTLKLKLARPLGHGRFPMVTRSSSLEHPTDDGAEISELAIKLTSKVKEKDLIRLAGVQVHNLERAQLKQLGLFDKAPGSDAKREKLNRALDTLAHRFGDETVTRGMAKAERVSPTRRIK
jgi:DNA polymerase-4